MSVIENKQKVKCKLTDDEIIDVKNRKLGLETCVETQKNDADKLSFKAEQKNDLILLIKANTFWKTSTEKNRNQLSYWIKP